MTLDEGSVKEKWFNDYRQLYNHVECNDEFDDKFSKECTEYRTFL